MIMPIKTGTSWHTLPIEEVQNQLGTSSVGLSETEALQRLSQYGPNRLPSRKTPPIGIIFLRQFLNPLIYILLIAGVVSLVIGENTDAFFIFGVIVFNAILGMIQEWKAEKSAASLQSLLKITALVQREGLKREMDAESLVPGDLVFLESGMTVPADIRLFETGNLAIEEAVLTGESLASEKSTLNIPMEDTPVSERSNIAYAGTTVMVGRASGFVVATGMQTEIGQIAKSIAHAPATKTPLIERMERFSKQISFAYVAGCILLAAVALWQGMSGGEVFLMAVALAVSAIPEGLPVALTIVLSIASQRMANRNVIVRKLTAVEGLGSCTCIASDKTGTLTLNRQTVRKISLGNGRRFLVSGEGYQGEGKVQRENGEPLSSGEKEMLLPLAQAGVLCNEATLRQENGQWVYQGDAVDVALLALGLKMGVAAETVRHTWNIVGQVPYESEKRYAAIFYRKADSHEGVVKGALETILPLCTQIKNENQARPIDHSQIEQEALHLAQEGYRVIAVAQGSMKSEQDAEKPLDIDQFETLSLLGLVGLIDPLRPEAKEAAQTCKQAGIKVVIITGDHPDTAFAIAKELGTVTDRAEVITGTQLAEIDSPESPAFMETVQGGKVFARVTPLQKLHIVEALRRLGHYVAVTGDGVNDAPALKAANIGVAMGSGTDVAKNTASIVVADDNFASIVAGVEEGRFAYDNVRKVVYLLISTGISEVVLFALALIVNMPLPLLAVQLLWLNLVTDGIQDFALAFEGGEPGALARPPRSPKEGIFNRQMIEQTVLAGSVMGLVAFGAWAGWQWVGRSEFEARNLTLLLMVLLENFHVFNCRSENISTFKVPLSKNIYIVMAAVAAQALHIGSMHIPFMQKILQIGPIRPYEWFCHLLLGATVLLAMEGYKLMRNRKQSSTSENSAIV
jgi:magnesium-transporting ATPase (P-type)